MNQDWLLLALTPGLGAQRFLKLIEAFGSAQMVVQAKLSQLTPIVGQELALALQQRVAQADVDAALAWAQAPDCHLLTLLDEDYPSLLAEADRPPPLLFARGQRRLLGQPMLALVGSRAATAQGKKNAQDFARQLAQHGYTIVSGLASGIDAAAHQGALDTHASTIAIIGTGIDRVYPASHRQLAHQIAEQGLILSEFPLGVGPLSRNFPQRNRIIAGLCRGCLVVEANIASGSLITARLAMENNREVMAIPGSIHSAQSRGCHRLIKQGAKLIESVDDVLEEVGALALELAISYNTSSSPAHPPLLEAMGFDPISVDELLPRLSLTAGELYAMLLELELEGKVASVAGGRFQRLAEN